MAILSEIRKRPWILIGILALALLAFVVDPSSLDKYFGPDPDVLGKVNGDKITREEFEDEIFILQQQAPGQPREALEEQAWQMLVQSKLVQQQFEKMGFEMTEDLFWNQIQFDPMFAQNPQLFDEKGNFKVQELKREVESMQATDPEGFNNWRKIRKGIEYRIMGRILLSNLNAGATVSDKEAEEALKQQNTTSVVDYVKIDYEEYVKDHKVTVTDKDLQDYIKKYPLRFKTDASRNIGVVLFPAKPSAEDEAAVKAEIEKLNTVGMDMGDGIENFQNTKSDSLFVMVNSDVHVAPDFAPISQQPQEIRDFLQTAAIGQSFGPYKVQDRYYAISKLMAKKPSDSVRSRHILIAYKGSPADQTGQLTRTKEQAKKLADSIGAVVKANPGKFTEFVNLSADTGSAAQGGELGWTTDSTPFVPEFKTYLKNNPSGAVGVVETQYGYHIINIEEKKSVSPVYKVANLVKELRPSDKTNSNIYTEANKFIQQIQGKGFNDFKNIAEKNNYVFANPKAANRFQGAIQGINSDKDSEILGWAFDKKTKVGEANIFTTSNGDYVVTYLAGKQDAGLINPEAVREQLEPIVRNELLAKQIKDKIAAEKNAGLDQLAKTFKTTKQSNSISMMNPLIGGGMEPRVAGVAYALKDKAVSQPIEGYTGVYVIQKKSQTTAKNADTDVKTMVQNLQRQNSQVFGQALLRSLQENADIKDYRIEVYNKTGSL